MNDTFLAAHLLSKSLLPAPSAEDSVDTLDGIYNFIGKRGILYHIVIERAVRFHEQAAHLLRHIPRRVEICEKRPVKSANGRARLRRPKFPLSG